MYKDLIYQLYKESAHQGNIGDARRESLLFQAAQALEVQQWQPIETAPKDGTHILLVGIGADNRPMTVIASWTCIEHLFLSSRHPSQCDDCNKEWYGTSRFGIDFTHWMPLPQPPEDE